MMRASSALSSSMAARHSLTELGTCSRARRRTTFFDSSAVSSSAARSHSLTLVEMCRMALASTALACSGVASRAASSHTSSLSGHVSHPLAMSVRAIASFPANASTRAAAIHPGPCLGLVVVTLLRRRRAFLMSPISESVDTLIEFNPVRYPFGSTTVWPVTESDILSSWERGRGEG